MLVQFRLRLRARFALQLQYGVHVRFCLRNESLPMQSLFRLLNTRMFLCPGVQLRRCVFYLLHLLHVFDRVLVPKLRYSMHGLRSATGSSRSRWHDGEP